jgi:hypothetical protein
MQWQDDGNLPPDKWENDQDLQYSDSINLHIVLTYKCWVVESGGVTLIG